jgi:hypothetical protein
MSHAPDDIRSKRRRRRRGQSLVELAVATPVLLILLMGAFNMGVLLSDKIMAGYASRQGARLAAQLGNGSGLASCPAGTCTNLIDQQIYNNVYIAANNLNYATLTEIDIYAPSSSDGSLISTDPANKYSYPGSPPSLTTTGGGLPYTARLALPPNETSIGVQIVWQYTPPTGFASFTVQLKEYAVMKVVPILPQ